MKIQGGKDRLADVLSVRTEKLSINLRSFKEVGKEVKKCLKKGMRKDLDERRFHH